MDILILLIQAYNKPATFEGSADRVVDGSNSFEPRLLSDAGVLSNHWDCVLQILA